MIMSPFWPTVFCSATPAKTPLLVSGSLALM
jgi:hypothetical protein